VTAPTTRALSEGSGALALVARKGSACSGTAAGGLLDLQQSRAHGAGGRVLCRPDRRGRGREHNNGVWSEGSGVLALVARKGQRCPRRGRGGELLGPRQSRDQRRGATAFFASLTGAGVDATNDGASGPRIGRAGLWWPAKAALPRHAGGGELRRNVGSLVLNGAGRDGRSFAFLTGAGVDGTNDRGIWSEGSQRLGGQLSGTAS